MEIVNGEAIGQKASKCPVKYLGNGELDVVSATSGNIYRVTCYDGWAWARCSCKWGQYHPEGMDMDKGCSHVQAAHQWVLTALECGAEIECGNP